jgi:hypothetical protein
VSIDQGPPGKGGGRRPPGDAPSTPATTPAQPLNLKSSSSLRRGPDSDGKKRADPTYDPALPPNAIDTIRDGITAAAFRAAGPFAMHKALNSIALSLQARGGTYVRYTELILGDGSKLGFQLQNPARKQATHPVSRLPGTPAGVEQRREIPRRRPTRVGP